MNAKTLHRFKQIELFLFDLFIDNFYTMTDSSFGKMSIIVNIWQLTHDLNHSFTCVLFHCLIT